MAMKDRIKKAGVQVLGTFPGKAGAKARFVAMRSKLEANENVAPDKVRELGRELLAIADGCHEGGEDPSGWVYKALYLLFHPTVHHRQELSPLSDSSLAYLEPFRASKVISFLTQHDQYPTRVVSEGGRRVLVVSLSSWKFVERMATALESRGFVFEFFDVSELKSAVTGEELIRMRYEYAKTGKLFPVPAELGEAIDRCDTVFIEWGTTVATWLSVMDIPKRVVLRVHSYEAYSWSLPLTAWENIDHTIFISPHVRALVEATSPGIATVPRSTLYNVNDTSSLSVDKELGYEKTLLLAGWSLPVKDVLFALDVLERVISVDPSYRLLLAGADIERVNPSRYEKRVAEQLERLSDHVEILGYRTDMPNVFKKAGILLSTSKREGFPQIVDEAAWAGTLPLVRDWPEFRQWGGASGLYPKEWVFNTPGEMAERITELGKNGAIDSARNAARKFMESTRHPEQNLELYANLLTQS